MVSCLKCIVDTSRRRGSSLRSEIANREDPYAVAVDILSKFRMNKNTRIFGQCFIQTNTKPIVLCSLVLVFSNVHCTSKIDGHFIMLRNREYHNNLQIKLLQMTRHSAKTARV